jgi:ACS family glucarate transporter-like MFS transporter
MEQSQGRMSRQRYILIGILFFHSVNTYMDRACIASAVDYIKRDLNITSTTMGLILGIFAVGYALFQIPSGWIADRLGARKALTIVVSVWSCFTALTGAAVNAVQMMVLRFLFGVGEAGAFPGATQAFFRWLPVKERGLAHGINFSGSRLGAAFSLFLMPWLISIIGWRWTFVVNGVIGIIWATVWLIWFRDNPADNPKVNKEELEYIEKGRVSDFTATVKSSFEEVFTSLNMSLAMLQYFASNVTFYISLTWLPSYLKNQWPDDPKAIYFSATPLIFAAFANWTAGTMVTQLFKRGYHVGSRRITAIVGFSLGVVGLLLATRTDNMYWFVFCFSLATFGVDMTLSPSWAFCNDIGGGNSGAVSGSMNMVGNFGAAISIILFPFLQNEVTGSANKFFILAACITFGAIIVWCFMNPNRVSDKKLSPAAIRIRFIKMMTAIITILLSIIDYNMYNSYKREKAKEESKQVVPEVQNDNDNSDSSGDNN